MERGEPGGMASADAYSGRRWEERREPEGASRLNQAGFYGLLVLALALPFEFTQHPFIYTSALTINDLKIVLYIVAALAVATLVQQGKHAARATGSRSPTGTYGFMRTYRWGVYGRAYAPTPQQRVPLALLAGLLLCCLLSTALAHERGAGLKWTSDLLLGGLLWAAMPLWLARERERKIRALATAIVVGAAIAGGVGILEFLLGPGFAADLGWFKAKPTLAGSYLRLSGTFEYANIAAMYMELALPFAVAGLVGALARPRAAWALVLAWMAAIEVLLMALLLTYSRGALLGLAGAGAVTLLMLRHRGAWRWSGGTHVGGHSSAPLQGRRRNALYATAGLALLTAAITLTATPLARLRFTSQSDQEWYQAAYQSHPPATMSVCRQVIVPVTVVNHSPFRWEPAGSHLYNLGYHWLYPSGTVALFENPRSRLRAPIPPGAAQPIEARVQAPPRPGRYLLVWDMVQENVTWFSLKRASYVGYAVQVRGAPARGAMCPGRSESVRSGGPATLPRSFTQPGRTQLWAAALRMLAAHPLLGVGPDGFRFTYGHYMRSPLAGWDMNILANQLFLELFADLGLLGGGLFLAFLVAVWWPLVVSLWLRRRSTYVVWQLALLAAFAALVSHGMVDYLLESHAIFLLLWLLCGMATATVLPTAPPGLRRTG